MLKLSLLTFVLTFGTAYSVISFIATRSTIQNQIADQVEINIIQQDIKERFHLFLDTSLMVGQISAEYLNNPNNKNHYSELVKKIFSQKEYLLGLNRLDMNGKIISTYPINQNLGAFGKTTQNLEQIIASFKRGEEYWLSPPFKLYQGNQGFAFYVPIVKDKKLTGWIAPVISTELFFKDFRDTNFFSTYELTIKDKETNLDYFSTAEPPESAYLYQAEDVARGRKVIIQSWHKHERQVLTISVFWNIFLSFTIALLAAFLTRLILQKRRTVDQLHSISQLLRLTSKEALSKLVDIHSEYMSSGTDGFLKTSVVEKDVYSVNNLIEQIDLLQTMAESEDVKEEVFPLLPILESQLANLDDVIAKKNLLINLKLESFQNAQVKGNKWLLSNTVIKNALTNCALLSKPKHTINIFFDQSHHESSLNFQLDDIHESIETDAFNLERKLLVARNTMSLFGGDIILKHPRPDRMLIKINFKTT